MRQGIKLLMHSFTVIIFLLTCGLSFKSFGSELPESEDSHSTLISKTYTFQQLGWNTSNTLKGPQAIATFYLPLYKEWKYRGANLHLIVTHSPLLREDSSLTLQINNALISSMLFNKANGEARDWEISIPENSFIGDGIALNFIGSLRINSDICKDDSSGNWAYISPDSTLTINYEKLPFNMTLDQLPSPFAFRNIIEAKNSLLVIPSSSSSRELAPALQTTRALGAQLNYNKINLDVSTFETITEQQKKNNELIAIGTTKQLQFLKPYPISSNAKLSNNITPDTGIISLKASPWNQFNALLTITGDNDLALSKAVAAFSDPQFTKLANDKIILVTEKPQISHTDKNSSTLPITLKSLGYKDQTALGLGQNTLSYPFTLSANQLAEKLILKTILSHSAFKSSDHSMLTVAINGIKQASLFLTPTNENNSLWSITIPQNALNPGNNYLTYTFDLHLPGNCAPLYNYEAWGVIHANTTMQASFSDRLLPIILSYFTLALNDNTLIVIPDNLDKPQLQALIQFFLKLGSLLGANYPSLNLVNANEVNESILAKYSNILIGTVQNNPWLAQAIANAPLKIDQNKLFFSNKNNQLSLTNQEPVGVVELMNSPWNFDKNTLLITGTNTNAISWSINLLTDDQLRSQLTGNIGTINAKRQVTSFETRSDLAWSFRLSKGFTKQNRQALAVFVSQNFGLVIFGLFLILMIFLVILGFYIRRKNS